MKPKKLRKVLEFKDRDQVRILLSLASGATAQNETTQILMDYIKDPKLVLYGFFDGPVLSGLIGLRLLPQKQGEIVHIAVRPEDQKKGFGRELIERTRDKHKLKRVTVDVGNSHKEFFETVGFNVYESYGTELGVKRFKLEMGV